MARGDYVYINKKSNGNSACYGGIRYRITNSLEDAIATNRDVIEMIMYVYRTSTGVTAHTGNYTSYYKHTINGTTTTNNVTTTIDMSKASSTNTKYYLSSSLPLKRVSGAGPTITFEVPHNADGTAPSVSIQAWIEFGSSSADYVNVTQTLTLDSIPRGSTLNPIDDFALDESFNISITKQVSSYTDNLVIKCGTTTIKTYNGIVDGTNISFTSAEQSTIKGLMTSPQIDLTFELSTYNNGTQVGETSIQTATVTTLDQPLLDSWVKSSDGYKYCVNGLVDDTLDDGLQVNGEIYKNGIPINSIMTGMMNANYTLSTQNATKLTLVANSSISSGTGLSISNGGIKIGAGITKVLVNAQIHFAEGGTGSSRRGVQVFKNNINVAYCNINNVRTYTGTSISPFLLEVQENDIIYLYGLNQGTTGSQVQYQHTWLTVQVID